MECISSEVKNNWALKLANLRRLKKSLDKYTEEELKVSISKFDRIDLPLIARKGSPDEILKLFEYVMYAVVQCPEKHVFIRRIMELEESVQIQLMFFIQKIIGEEENSNKENQGFKREIELLKLDKKRLNDQLLEMENELSLAHEEYAILHSDYQQVKFESERINSELDKRSEIGDKECNALAQELKLRLSEKDESIAELKKLFEKSKKQYEAEITQMKDELDIANSKILEVSKVENLLTQYKKRVEGLSSLKTQVEELQKQNEIYSETISRQNIEIDGLVCVKVTVNAMKEDLEKEISRAEILAFSVETKEKTIRQLNKSLVEYKQKVNFLTKKNEELMFDDRAESFQASENSFAGDFEADPNVFNKEIKVRNSTYNEIEADLLRDIEKLRNVVGGKKAKLKCYKETVQMNAEEMLSRRCEYSESLRYFEFQVNELQENNYILSDEIQKMTETLKEKESEQIIYEQTLEELDEVKASKVSLLNDIKNLNLEKEQMHKKYVESNEFNDSVIARLGIKESQVSEIKYEVTALKEQLRAYQEREALFEKEISAFKENSNEAYADSSRFLDLEKEIIAVRSEAASLKIHLEAKVEKISNLKEENAKVVEEMKKKLAEAREEFDKELEEKNQEMVTQLEEAMNELTKQRELLAGKLQTERRNTVVNFHRAMSIKDPSAMMNKEVFKLRSVLVDKEKEIQRLSRNNREIKSCWKESAKLLKAVWKELGRETQKIEDAVRERISL